MTQLRKGNDWGVPVQKVGIFFENLFNRSQSKVKVSYRKAKTSSTGGLGSFSSKSNPSSLAKTQESTQEEIDLILDKIAEKGYDALSKKKSENYLSLAKSNSFQFFLPECSKISVRAGKPIQTEILILA